MNGWLTPRLLWKKKHRVAGHCCTTSWAETGKNSGRVAVWGGPGVLKAAPWGGKHADVCYLGGRWTIISNDDIGEYSQRCVLWGNRSSRKRNR